MTIKVRVEVKVKVKVAGIAGVLDEDERLGAGSVSRSGAAAEGLGGLSGLGGPGRLGGLGTGAVNEDEEDAAGINIDDDDEGTSWSGPLSFLSSAKGGGTTQGKQKLTHTHTAQHTFRGSSSGSVWSTSKM
jgi:hypothetical protein